MIIHMNMKGSERLSRVFFSYRRGCRDFPTGFNCFKVRFLFLELGVLTSVTCPVGHFF